MTTNITTQPETGRPTTSSANGSWLADGKKPASRLRGTTRRRSIPHLLLGVLLVLACAAAFLVVSLNSGTRQPVLALARPVSVGQVLTTQDLKQVNVAVDPGVSVVDASQAASVVGKTMSTSLPVGALLTLGAVSGAVHAGRRAVGIEYEPHWVDVARANLALARDAGMAHEGRVFHGDARQIASLLPAQYAGQAALVVTSPPYGPSTHGQVSVAPGAGVQKYHHLYGNTLDRGNLANIGHHRLLSGFTRILAGLTAFLRPGGHIAITIRPWREHAELIDLPSQILACGLHAGLIPVERCVALLARAAGHDLVARGSFFQRDFIRKQREAGLPLHLIAHEDVLTFRTALRRPASSRTSTDPHDSRRFLSGRARHAGNPRHESGVPNQSRSWAA